MNPECCLTFTVVPDDLGGTDGELRGPNLRCWRDEDKPPFPSQQGQSPNQDLVWASLSHPPAPRGVVWPSEPNIGLGRCPPRRLGVGRLRICLVKGLSTPTVSCPLFTRPCVQQCYFHLPTLPGRLLWGSQGWPCPMNSGRGSATASCKPGKWEEKPQTEG
jgi:hypothetical protein